MTKAKPVAVFFLALLVALPAFSAGQSPLLNAMTAELDRSFTALHTADEVPLYYLSYQVCDVERHNLAASYGALERNDHSRQRTLDIDCRVGDFTLDNTHEIRGEFDPSSFNGAGGARIPLDDDELAIRTVIWRNTDEAYKNALERYTKVKTNQQVLVEKEDTSADFSREKAAVFIGKTAHESVDVEFWKSKLAAWSARFKDHPEVQTSGVRLSLTNDNRYFVDSDGAKIETGQAYARLSLYCSGICDDGMSINRTETFDADSPNDLPTGEEVDRTITRLIDELKALLSAPLAEPYAGPAILVNRASGVFFHEIFGHRIEGHRQKSESEGQTFARMVGKQILPDFISVYDDPTLEEFDGTFLRGFYRYDDEGVPGQRVSVVEQGILKNFLMSRSPINNFPNSNGHGRKEPGASVVARQGNLMIESDRQYPFDSLLVLLADECRKQDKPYGLIFYDISGGFTQTGRRGPQSFKVLPLLVYRYYADGRPMEAIRGVDIVGTPLSSFEKIIATGDDYGVFNGTCGAESGWVPVSAMSPSILVSQVEVEKKSKEQEKPPLLPPPYEPSGDKTIMGGLDR
ncbi:MAG: peptidase U62 [candidate division Zixibacteria bacterium]|nr:peptidase U62 [candidate division Zixibacteria bacterium]